MANDVVAKEKVWERVPIPKTDRTRRVLRFSPGQIVPEAEAKRLGVSAAGKQAVVPTAETDPSGVIPLAARKKAAAKKAAKRPAKRTTKATKAAKKRAR